MVAGLFPPKLQSSSKIQDCSVVTLFLHDLYSLRDGIVAFFLEHQNSQSCLSFSKVNCFVL